MKKMRILTMVLLAVLLFQTAAFAKMTEGKVLSVDPVANKFQLKLVDPAAESVWIDYDENTSWPVGVTDPRTLENQTVRVEAEQEAMDGGWLATTVYGVGESASASPVSSAY